MRKTIPLHRQKMRQGLNAFTLIELLVSIAVVGILSWLAMAGVGVAREHTNRTRNVANLSSLIQFWNMYAVENNGFFPLGLTWADNGTVQNPPDLVHLSYRYWWSWYGGIGSYTPTTTVGDTAAQQMGGPLPPTWPTVWRGWYPPTTYDIAREQHLSGTGTFHHTGYHFNTQMGLYRRIPIVQMVDPSRTPVLFAYWNKAGEPTSAAIGQYFSSPVADQAGFMAGATDVFRTGNHFAFADGRVEWVEKLGTAEAYRQRMRWTPVD